MLSQLVAKLGRARLERLLQRAKPELERQYADLRQHLQQYDWRGLKRSGHALKGTARLLECDELLRCLEVIEREDWLQVQESDYQVQLDRAYNQCLAQVSQLLCG